VDFTVRRPQEFGARFGHVLDYMARVELEVDRNVLEISTMLPNPPEVDKRFYAEGWQPQEIQHGLILDRLQQVVGRPPATTDLDRVGLKLKVLGLLAHLEPFQDVCRMLYYLTGMATERSAVIAYNLLHDGVVETGEQAVAETVIAPIKRQEPGHYAFYQLSARAHWARLVAWQKWLVRRMRRISFAPVGVNNATQLADFGDVMETLGIDSAYRLGLRFGKEGRDLAADVARVEQELLWARDRGLPVPDYVARAFREAVEAAQARSAA